MNNQTALFEVMELFLNGAGFYNAGQVAAALDKEKDVVEGMLDTLASLGKLEVASRRGCDFCPLGSVCLRAEIETPCYRLSP